MWINPSKCRTLLICLKHFTIDHCLVQVEFNESISVFEMCDVSEVEKHRSGPHILSQS